jgi:hypothetical protein
MQMKKLFLSILVLGLLLFGCQDPSEKAFKNCIKEIEGEKYKGTLLNEAGAAVVCQQLKKKYPDIFKESKGKFLSFFEKE